MTSSDQRFWNAIWNNETIEVIEALFIGLADSKSDLQWLFLAIYKERVDIVNFLLEKKLMNLNEVVQHKKKPVSVFEYALKINAQKQSNASLAILNRLKEAGAKPFHLLVETKEAPPSVDLNLVPIKENKEEPLRILSLSESKQYPHFWELIQYRHERISILLKRGQAEILLLLKQIPLLAGLAPTDKLLLKYFKILSALWVESRDEEFDVFTPEHMMIKLHQIEGGKIKFPFELLQQLHLRMQKIREEWKNKDLLGDRLTHDFMKIPVGDKYKEYALKINTGDWLHLDFDDQNYFRHILKAYIQKLITEEDFYTTQLLYGFKKGFGNPISQHQYTETSVFDPRNYFPHMNEDLHNNWLQSIEKLPPNQRCFYKVRFTRNEIIAYLLLTLNLPESVEMHGAQKKVKVYYDVFFKNFQIYIRELETKHPEKSFEDVKLCLTRLENDIFSSRYDRHQLQELILNNENINPDLLDEVFKDPAEKLFYERIQMILLSININQTTIFVFNESTHHDQMSISMVLPTIGAFYTLLNSLYPDRALRAKGRFGEISPNEMMKISEQGLFRGIGLYSDDVKSIDKLHQFETDLLMKLIHDLMQHLAQESASLFRALSHYLRDVVKNAGRTLRIHEIKSNDLVASSLPMNEIKAELKFERGSSKYLFFESKNAKHDRSSERDALNVWSNNTFMWIQTDGDVETTLPYFAKAGVKWVFNTDADFATYENTMQKLFDNYVTGSCHNNRKNDIQKMLYLDLKLNPAKWKQLCQTHHFEGDALALFDANLGHHGERLINVHKQFKQPSLLMTVVGYYLCHYGEYMNEVEQIKLQFLELCNDYLKLPSHFKCEKRGKRLENEDERERMRQGHDLGLIINGRFYLLQKMYSSHIFDYLLQNLAQEFVRREKKYKDHQASDNYDDIIRSMLCLENDMALTNNYLNYFPIRVRERLLDHLSITTKFEEAGLLKIKEAITSSLPEEPYELNNTVYSSWARA